MISSRELKYYSSLLVKKFRTDEKKFIAEGIKTVEEGLNSNYECDALFATPAFIESNPDTIKRFTKKAPKFYQLKSLEFQRISDTKSPQGIAAAFIKAGPVKKITECSENNLVLLDNISDPGNLGTILRTCDWFGIKNILITYQSVEYLNPKVIRSSMGSVFHLNIYDNLNEHDLAGLRKNGYKIIISDLKGKNIFGYNFPRKSIAVFSNESTGPSDMVRNLSDEQITIPRKGEAESLNVASAAAIIISRITYEP